MAAEPTTTPTVRPTVCPVRLLGEKVSHGTPAPFDGYLIREEIAVGKIAVPTERYADELALAEDGRRARGGAFAAPGWYKWSVLVVTFLGLGLQSYREIRPKP